MATATIGNHGLLLLTSLMRMSNQSKGGHHTLRHHAADFYAE
jgi:hypothetical protein